jgi:hypothetical protein
VVPAVAAAAAEVGVLCEAVVLAQAVVVHETDVPQVAECFRIQRLQTPHGGV